MILVAPPPVIAPAARRDAGNFTIAAEDGYLAHAFVAVSTNAAVGTDQGGRMFWTKINEEFFRRGGKPSRACTSLKTRFSRTLQHDVNKYIGHLQGALREYHCGWVMATLPRLLTTSNAWRTKGESTTMSSRFFDAECQSKYELVTQTMHRRVSNALFLLDSNRMRQESDDDDDNDCEDEEDNVNNNVPESNDEDTATDNNPAVNALTVVPPPCTPATPRGFCSHPTTIYWQEKGESTRSASSGNQIEEEERTSSGRCTFC